MPTKPKPKKRGRKPGVKVGPYKKTRINDDGLEELTNKLAQAIRNRIKVLTIMLKRIK